MSDLNTKTVCIVDSGLFADFATLLAKSFKKVYLYIPWESNPSSNQMMIGTGLPGVEKTDHWSLVLQETDLFIFLDVNHGPLQLHLISLGKLVWGSRMGEELELYRDDAKNHFTALGLAVGHYEVVKGIDNLRKYLKENENVYVKISRSRGDFETFKSENYKLIEPLIDHLEAKLGAKKSIMDFIVEDAIEDAVEIGNDGFCIDGKFPSQVMSGIEVKDRAYVGVFKPYKSIPAQLRMVNTKLAESLRNYQYRNFLAIEVRVTRDGIPWVIDPCCRAGSPPSQLVQLMYKNLAEIIWHGAQGKLVDPIPAGRWGALCLILGNESANRWTTIDFPEKIRDNIKLHFPVILDGRYWTVPQKDEIIGAVVAVGETLESAIENVKSLAEQVQGHGIEIPVACLDDAQSEIDRLAEFDIKL